MKELIGHTIRHIYLSSDERMLRFDLFSGCLMFYGHGGCHTETWFKDINISILNAVPYAWQDIEEIEKISDFGYKIITHDFSITISALHSNVSSGSYYDSTYYGGEIRLATFSEIMEYKQEQWKEWIDIRNNVYELKFFPKE